jgi:quinoprotein dehydrogenase-associated probable ABC transporter substrate-binding protein
VAAPSRRRRALLGAALASLAGLQGAAPPAPARSAARVLRVCADPNNLPFSNRREEGLENRLARLIAADLGATVAYTWWPQRRAFLRNTIRANRCDVVMGVPSGYDPLRTTRPYYRSTYVFVYRRDLGVRIASLDDAALRRLRVGVHLMGDDGANSPPAHALASRGVIANVRGFPIYGDYSQPDPPARILDALARRELDVAIVWGPLAGYFAPRLGVPVEIVPVAPQVDAAVLPMAYDMSLGVRREDAALARELEAVLERRGVEVARLLRSYGVPIVAGAAAARGAAGSRSQPPNSQSAASM